jgi:hypothetical protein
MCPTDVVGQIKTCFCVEMFFNRVVYEKMSKNVVETDRPQMAVQ